MTPNTKVKQNEGAFDTHNDSLEWNTSYEATNGSEGIESEDEMKEGEPAGE